MELSQKKARWLYHYCVSIADALRTILNTENPEIDTAYWNDSLKNFQKVIIKILGTNSFEYEKMFKANVNALLSNPVYYLNKQIAVSEIIETAKIITDKTFSTLYGDNNE